ncbi:hypothetical protein LAZ29_02210 [Cereibacter sphaeroides]|uniref:hypothetical protein n=1 Tax=Cereibacter sphaeroides TaxID=1063 RepID=UPI001F336932|nr:hypothetical protein [Cereibacter sphaeroides]MCE6949736.1 hypothetical protein [Cereibacter sphaeroides]
MLKPTAAALLLALAPAAVRAGQTVVDVPPEPLPEVFAPTPPQIDAIAAELGDPALADALASAEPGSQEAIVAVGNIVNAYAERVIASGSLPPMTPEQRAAALDLLTRIVSLTGATPATRELIRRLSS